jgi:hypothetical protein
MAFVHTSFEVEKIPQGGLSLNIGEGLLSSVSANQALGYISAIIFYSELFAALEGNYYAPTNLFSSQSF